MNSIASHTLDHLLERQKRAWLEGSRPSIEQMLLDSSLSSGTDVVLDLIYNEVVVREELGESPALDEYVQRYPHLADDLRLQFEVHQVVQQNLLSETKRVDNLESVADGDAVVYDNRPALAAYEIVGELGRGGMGIVYQARHRRLLRRVALKMMRPGRRPTSRELERFRDEAEAIARLQHANIVQIFEVGLDDGMPFLALELADAGTLQQRLQRSPLASRPAAELVATLARAIQHAHEHQIVHRDLKPANVLFTSDGTPKIADFGLAKLLDADRPRDATRAGEAMGTPRYMSPEQAEGRPDKVGPATDVYALGTILFECMTGQVPFVSASIVETVDKIRHEQPPSPRRLQRSIPRDLETICLNCLQKQPAKRYSSAKDLEDDLGRFLRGEPIRARRTPLLERGWMWCRRRPAVATWIAACFVAIVASAIVFGIRQHRDAQRLAELRIEVAALVKEGQRCLLNGEGREARERFQEALSKVQAEPALRDHELGVRGWLDHALRDTEQQRWRQRNSPLLFDERRDDAFVQAALALMGDRAAVPAARQAVADAMSFTDVADPAWLLERESLLLLDAELAGAVADDPELTLAALDAAPGISTRYGLRRRADLLERLGRIAEARRERERAETLPEKKAHESLFRGVSRLKKRALLDAVGAFDEALSAEPDHLLARILQGMCFLEMNRTPEAKVALTACLGQRPHFAWAFLLRGRTHLLAGNHVAAAQDFAAVSSARSTDPMRTRLDAAIAELGRAIHLLPANLQRTFWDTTITCDAGMVPLRHVEVLQPLLKEQRKDQ